MPTTLNSSADPQLVANKAIVRSFIDAWNTRDFDRFEVLMGEDAVLPIGGPSFPATPRARAASLRSGRRRFRTGASSC
jgi:hypothetical protein